MLNYNRIKEVEKELIKAYKYFGADDSYIQEELYEQINELHTNYMDTIRIYGVEYSGKLTQVVSFSREFTETEYKGIACNYAKTAILYLFANDDVIKFVLFEYDYYEDNKGNPIDTENSEFRFVELEEVPVANVIFEWEIF